MLRTLSPSESSGSAQAAPVGLRLRVLVAGFDGETLHRLRRCAAASPDADVRLFSRRRSDLSRDHGSGPYDAILLHADAFGADRAQLDSALAAWVPEAPVVLAGAQDRPHFAEVLIQSGCEEVLSMAESQPEALISAVIKAAARRSRDEERDIQRAALQSLELSLGQGSADDEPILILGEEDRLSFANPAAQALGDKTIGQLVEQVALRQRLSPGVLIMRFEAQGEGGASHEFTVTATQVPVQERRFTILRVKTRAAGRVGEALEQRLSLLDPDTGLPGRGAFLQRLDEVLGKASLSSRRAGLILIEVDQMASITEALGHATGRALLNLVGQRLSCSLRPDDWLGYLGSSSFAVVAPDAPETLDLSRLADRLREEIGASLQLEGVPVSVTASMGIATFPIDGASVHELLHHADVALSRARAGGGNACEFFNVELGTQLRKQWQLQMAARLALEREEFWIAYQPVISSGEPQSVCGAEALLRWQHPQLGPLSPADFIPVLEQSGLIHAVGEWVLRRACLQAQRWRHDGCASFRMSVNVSPVQLRDPGFVRKVAAILAETGLPACALVLELTENLLLERTEEGIERLSALAALGVGLYIDDFGTGFSSIAYLKRLPFTGLKIDRSFVRSISDDPRDQALVHCMVSLARVFGLDTVAEGVETGSDAQTVCAIGVDRMQGFHYSAGVPPQDFGERYFKR